MFYLNFHAENGNELNHFQKMTKISKIKISKKKNYHFIYIFQGSVPFVADIYTSHVKEQVNKGGFLLKKT